MSDSKIGSLAILTKELRDMTGMSYGLCYAALNEASGDKVQALKILKQKGATRAEKLADRSTNFGYIGVYRHHDGKTVAMIELLCESDFVSRSEEFKKCADLLAMQVAVTFVLTNEDFLKEEVIFENGNGGTKTTVSDLIKELSAKTGENVCVGKIIKTQI